MAESAIRSDAAKAPGSKKQPWEPMKLVAVGTVAALLESLAGSKNDGGMAPPNMMVGL